MAFPAGGSSFVVVANRLPVDRVRDASCSEDWVRSPGGLVSALTPVMQRQAGTWVGWSGTPGEAEPPFELEGMRLAPVPLSGGEVADFYEGFSNATLWPLYHDVIVQPRFRRTWWEAYVVVNRRFAEATAAQAAQAATIWVQDYQLQLVPAMLRSARPDLRIGFFDHIPFPGYEIYARLPWRRQVIEGLLGADLVGFQRRDDAANFLRACRRAVGAATRGSIVEVAPAEGNAPAGSAASLRQVRAAAFPISIDSKGMDRLARTPAVTQRAAALRRELGNPRVLLLGVDRLDYTKGLIQRLRAYSELLDEGDLRSPEVTLVQVASPSRERVEEYQRVREELELIVSRINGEHGTLGRPAVHYLHQSFPVEEMAALYVAADVMLVTPLRDGMNLVAKEYVACHGGGGGALVLSEFAGAADELRQAFLVNPYDVAGLKETILRAVQVPPPEATRLMRALRRRVFQADVHRWAGHFLDALAAPPR